MKAICLILFLIFAGIKSQQELNDVGRYQLIQVKYYYIIAKIAENDSLIGNSEKNTVFKIDTKTGQTWKYYEADILHVEKGKKVENLMSWIEIEK